MTCQLRKQRVLSSNPEGLESRQLLATGIASGLNVVMELGGVSRTVAAKGVEVSAPIAANGSITFVFEAEASGNYLLKVRHTGDDLTLVAHTPAGSASINPGPVGPFSTIALSLTAAQYKITASADGDQPAFVDWELLLTSAVGQSAAIGSTLAVPLLGLPTANASATATPSTSASSTVSTSTASANWGQSISPSVVAVSGPIGRLEAVRAISPVGPTSPNGALALAVAGDELPAGVLKALNPIPQGAELPTSVDATLSPTPLLALQVLGDGQQDLATRDASSSWLDRLAEWAGESKTGPISAPTGELAAAVGDPGDETLENKSTLTASPGLITTGVIIAAALSRWHPSFKMLAKRRNSPTMSGVLGKSHV